MRPLRFALSSVTLLALAVACGETPAPVGPADSGGLASAGAAGLSRHIVIFRADVDDVPGLARRLTAASGGRLGTVYRYAVKGFAADLPVAALAGLRANPAVAYVEADQRVFAYGEVPTGVARIFADANAAIGIDGVDDVRVDVDVAIIDTGIADHPDLDVVGRTDCSSLLVAFGWPCSDGVGTDGNGHGTHVAGTVGAIDDGVGVVGVAPGARLWSVKALADDGSGYVSSIVAAIDWVTARAGQIEVANMSLGCLCASAAMDDAIAASVAAGVTYAVAAGNDASDTSVSTPGNHPDVITVSALADFDGAPGGAAASTCRADQDDTLAAFSNHGPLVEITAPGVCITSTYLNGGFATASGTSMASPHVAGAAALLAASGTTGPAAIRTTLIATGSFDWTDDSGDGIQEPLLDVSDATVYHPATVAGGGGGTPDPEPEPEPEPEPDDTPPNVEISNPSAGEVMSGNDQVRVAATDLEDAFGTLFVEVRVDGGPWQTAAFVENFYRWDWDTTVHADGEVVVEARGTDSGGNVTHATPVTAVVDNGSPAPPPEPEPSAVHVAGLSGTAVNEGKNWRAEVTIEVRDDLGSAVSGVTVHGGWVAGAIGTAQCTTDVSGACTVSSPAVRKKESSITWLLDELVHATLPHDPAADVANTITVTK